MSFRSQSCPWGNSRDAGCLCWGKPSLNWILLTKIQSCNMLCTRRTVCFSLQESLLYLSTSLSPIFGQVFSTPIHPIFLVLLYRARLLPSSNSYWLALNSSAGSHLSWRMCGAQMALSTPARCEQGWLPWQVSFRCPVSCFRICTSICHHSSLCSSLALLIFAQAVLLWQRIAL